MANLGFIGLGIMGKPMAKHLLSKGNKVLVYDVNPDSIRECCQSGHNIRQTYQCILLEV